MPCQVYSPAEISEMRQVEINKLTAWLCALLNHPEITPDMAIEACAQAQIDPASLANWWREHQRQDEERRNREALERRKAMKRKEALSKLTFEERDALGIRQ